jgi:hypothetical protein
MTAFLGRFFLLVRRDGAGAPFVAASLDRMALICIIPSTFISSARSEEARVLRRNVTVVH